jgi:hypothetical protein
MAGSTRVIVLLRCSSLGRRKPRAIVFRLRLGGGEFGIDGFVGVSVVLFWIFGAFGVGLEWVDC